MSPKQTHNKQSKELDRSFESQYPFLFYGLLKDYRFITGTIEIVIIQNVFSRLKFHRNSQIHETKWVLLALKDHTDNPIINFIYLISY